MYEEMILGLTMHQNEKVWWGVAPMDHLQSLLTITDADLGY